MTISELNDIFEADGIAEGTGPIETFAAEYADPARYDLEYGESISDLSFYLSLAELAEGPILDIACGTGRISLALANAGYAVTAVDVRPEMLAQAESKYGADEVVWVEQDARELQLRSKFGLAIIAGNAFQHLLTNADRDAVLKAIYRQLKPGGIFAFAVRFPNVTDLARTVETPEFWHTYLDAEGYEIVVTGTSRYDALAQVVEHHTYRHYAASGIPAAEPTITHLRYTFPQEIEAALKGARFQVEQRLGSFDGLELTEFAGSMIFVCRKPESTRRTA